MPLLFGTGPLMQEDISVEEEGAERAASKEEPVNKVLMQAFTLTFLAEWGDRSQIATIALVRVGYHYLRAWGNPANARVMSS